MIRTLYTAIIAAAALALLGGLAHADRIKDVASINGVRSNQLIGYGLVVGLDGTGDQTSQTQFTVQSLKSMLANLGVTLPPGINPQLKNVAAVMVTAELPAFAKPGQTIDVVASSIGNAKSLRGGTLLMTPLKGADGQTYALAQGNLLVSGFGAEGDDGSSITVNIPSAGGIPNGATVERGVLSPFADSPTLVMNLFGPDFTTAQRVVTSINSSMGAGVARALDATSIEIQAPTEPAAKVAFASMVENLEVVPAVAPARVMISSRTGTVVLSGEVRIERAAVAHGNLTVTVSESLNVSQPGALARRGQTVVTPESQLSVDQEDAKMFMVETGVSLNDVVAAVNRVGAAPGDLVAILYALQRAGALRAQLIVI